MFIRSLKIFIQTFGVFHLPRNLPEFTGWLARAGRFPWIEILAGLKEKGDLEVSALGRVDWRKFQIRVPTRHTQKVVLRIILSQLKS